MRVLLRVPGGVRVLATMVAAAGLQSFAAAQDAEPKIRLTPQDIQALADQAPKGGAQAARKMIALNGDSTKAGTYSQQVTLPAHSMVPPHTHSDNRTVYVVSGTLYVGYGEKRDPAELKELPPGSYYTEPAATPHYTETRDDAVVIVITGTGPSITHIIGAAPPAGGR